MIHLPSTVNVCTKCHCNPCGSWDISVWTKVMPQPSNRLTSLKRRRQHGCKLFLPASEETPRLQNCFNLHELLLGRFPLLLVWCTSVKEMFAKKCTHFLPTPMLMESPVKFSVHKTFQEHHSKIDIAAFSWASGRDENKNGSMQLVRAQKHPDLKLIWKDVIYPLLSRNLERENKKVFWKIPAFHLWCVLSQCLWHSLQTDILTSYQSFTSFSDNLQVFLRSNFAENCVCVCMPEHEFILNETVQESAAALFFHDSPDMFCELHNIFVVNHDSIVILGWTCPLQWSDYYWIGLLVIIFIYSSGIGIFQVLVDICWTHRAQGELIAVCRWFR